MLIRPTSLEFWPFMRGIHAANWFVVEKLSMPSAARRDWRVIRNVDAFPLPVAKALRRFRMNKTMKILIE
jgi:hypothetical protein